MFFFIFTEKKITNDLKKIVGVNEIQKIRKR